MKILILSASIGAGHVRAAEAIEKRLAILAEALPPSKKPEVLNLDVLSFMPKPFRKVYCDGYFKMVAKAPRVLGWLFDRTDRPFHKDHVRLKLEQAGARKLIKKIREFDPDVSICTHFVPTVLLDRENRKERMKTKIATVVTDFEVHGMWLTAPSDHYFVATDEAHAHLRALGIKPEDITVSGIPTHHLFSEKKDRTRIRKKLDWRPDLPTALLSAGGLGAVNLGRLLEQIISAEVPIQLIAVCGKSASLKTALEKIAEKRKRQAVPVVKVVGFTNEMDEFMAASDLVIGKPGGLTTSESLIKGLGWVVVNPIPGQEEQNALYLLEQGVGVWCDNLHTIAFKLRWVLEDPGRLESMKNNALRVAKPQAAEVIARWALGSPDTN